MHLRLRLFLAFLFLIVVTLLALDIYASQNTEQEVRGFIRRGGLLGAEEVVTSLEEYHLKVGSWEGVNEVFEARNSGNSTYGKGQGRGEGRGYGQYQENSAGKNLRLVDAGGKLLYDPLSLQEVGSTVSQDELKNAITLYDGDEVVGYLLSQYGINQSEYETDLMNIINHASMHAAILAGALAVVLAIVFSYVLLRPVGQLTRAAGELAKGDLSQRVSVRGNDELATLGLAFNQMAGSLEDAENRRKALVADIAHELRTPLAVQRANLEAIQDGVYPMSMESLEPIIAQTALLTRLVEDLRTLAMADAGELSLHPRKTDLVSLVENTLDRFQTKAAEKNIKITLQLRRDCPMLEIDPERVQQILHNLMQNSLRHTPTGGQITVSLRCEGAEAIISVLDSGEGIPADALPHIFERFYRVDRSRSRLEGGTGLGLAIARQLARAHGGDLRAENQVGAGAVFSLSLPLSDPF